MCTPPVRKWNIDTTNDHVCLSDSQFIKILTASIAKVYSADCIPPSIIKACPDLFSELIAQSANHSFIFPFRFKHALVVPLLLSINTFLCAFTDYIYLPIYSETTCVNLPSFSVFFSCCMALVASCPRQ